MLKVGKARPVSYRIKVEGDSVADMDKFVEELASDDIYVYSLWARPPTANLDIGAASASEARAIVLEKVRAFSAR